MLGTITGGRLVLEEIHRFPNIPVAIDRSTRWDILHTFGEIKTGLRLAAGREVEVRSVSVDSWGVDYVWHGCGQSVLALPFIYRDPRSAVHFERATRQPGREKIFAETGIQFMALNTLYQLMADRADHPALTEAADGFLLIADFFLGLFSGVRCAEESLASTTQLYNPAHRAWSEDLIAACGLDRRHFPKIVPAGTRLGPLTDEVREETGLGPMEVVATCSHDTGAAVAAVPGVGDDWAFLSSGTWSLIGVELAEPLISEEARVANFTNEAGFGGTTRFLRNIVGLWILQECRRAWEREGKVFDYAELNRLAAEADPLVTVINPDDPRFLEPGRMPGKIAAFCAETNQPAPSSPGAMARCILESLALVYCESLTTLETLTGRSLRTLHIVGGGSKSTLLNQFAANATGRTVQAGPVEATAIGNILIQAVAMREIASIDDLRAMVRRSFPVDTFVPEDAAAWATARDRFRALRVG